MVQLGETSHFWILKKPRNIRVLAVTPPLLIMARWWQICFGLTSGLGTLGNILILAALLSGCGQMPSPDACSGIDRTLQPGSTSSPVYGQDPKDPMESYNRTMMDTNTCLDRTLFAPFTAAYRAAPSWGRKAIANLLNFVETPLRLVNCLLQGDLTGALEHTVRFLANGTIGVCGLVDAAGLVDVHGRKTDFGETLKAWGVPCGTYAVLPILGPAHWRDAIGRMVDCFLVPVSYVLSTALVYYPLSYTYLKATYGAMQEDIEKTFDDPYVAIRDAYFQSRGDGDPDTASFEKEKEGAPKSFGDHHNAAQNLDSDEDWPDDVLNNGASSPPPSPKTQGALSNEQREGSAQDDDDLPDDLR